MARTHVVVSDEVMRAVDARVGQRGRSRFLEEAAREKLARMALEESLQETSGILAGSTRRDWADRDSTRRWVRAVRNYEAGEPSSG